MFYLNYSHHGLNDFYSTIIKNSLHELTIDIPAEYGMGSVSQVANKHGIVMSDWQMWYESDMPVQGQSGSENIQIIFCLNEGLTWGIIDEPGTVNLKKGEAYISKGHGKTEYTYYPKRCDFRFKCIRIPTAYFSKLLSEHFEPREIIAYEKKLFAPSSKITITPYLYRILAEMKSFVQYRGGLGHLYLESKMLEMLSAYLSEVLELRILAPDKTYLKRTDRMLILETKRIIDSQLGYAPSCEELSKQIGMSVSKLSKGFTEMIGMPIHSYIIDQRLETAARLLLDSDMNISQIAAFVGYSKPSNFAAAFKKKYGILPKLYQGVGTNTQ
jgi:AraC-like DNA-binding protein